MSNFKVIITDRFGNHEELQEGVDFTVNDGVVTTNLTPEKKSQVLIQEVIGYE